MDLDVFEYSNFREYLRDFYRASKAKNRNFSYRTFARRAGYSSSAFLPLIIDGKRNLTKDFVPKFADAIGLGKRERQYFEALVAFNQAKTPEAKRYYMELLRGIKKGRVGAPIEEAQFEYLSTWYYPVIRELVALPSFEESPHWIRRRLRNKVTAGEVEEALGKLVQLGLLARDASGKLAQADGIVATDDEVHYTAVYAFHQQMLTLAKEVLATTKGDGHEITGITMPVSRRQHGRIREMIREFQQEVLRYLDQHQDEAEHVSQLNIQFLNITHDAGRQNA